MLTAGGAAEALRQARCEAVDAILCDVVMEELDGFALCRRLREEPWLSRVPVVLASAYYNDPDAEQLALHVGASALVSRTPDLSAEIDALRGSLRQRSTPCLTRQDPGPLEAHVQRNVHELAKVVDTARRSDERYHTLFENALDAISVLTPDGIIVEANHRWEDILKIPPSQLIGRHVSEVSARGHEDANTARFLKSVKGGGGREEAVPLQRSDGVTVYMEFSMNVVHLNGAALCICIGRDVTERILAGMALQAAEEKYRALVERMPEAVWTTDGAGRITYMSPNVVNICGFTAEELCAEDLAKRLERVHPEDHALIIGAFDGLFKNRKSFDVEYRRRRKNGTWAWSRLRAVAAGHDRNGAPIVEGLLSDVTDRRHLEDQLRHAQKMEAVGTLAGGVAHDFNNMLNVLLGYTMMLLDGMPADHPMHEALSEMRRAGERSADLTRQLLAFSRQEPQEVQLLDINESVRSVERLAKRLVGENIEVHSRLAPEGCTIQADPGQMDQILMNLVVNARDAMPDGGTLTFETSVVTCDDVHTPHGEMQPGRYALLSGERHRGRDEQGNAGAHLRALLHDQGVRQRHGPRPLDRVRDRPAIRRPHRRGDRTGPRNDLQRVPTPRLGRGEGDVAAKVHAKSELRQGDDSSRRGRGTGPKVRGDRAPKERIRSAGRTRRKGGRHPPRTARRRGRAAPHGCHDAPGDGTRAGETTPRADAEDEGRLHVRTQRRSADRTSRFLWRRVPPETHFTACVESQGARGARRRRRGVAMTTVTKHVLVVDDEPGMLRMLTTALNQYGFVTDEASDGRQALELVCKKSFDVIVSDINMPRYPGLEFLRGVREHDADVPVIMMTGKPSVESSARSVEYGAFRYLIKPIMPLALKEAVEGAVRQHEVARVKRRALESYGMDHKTLEDLAALELRFASAMDGLWVAFQPIVAWGERTVYGYEALVRSAEPSLSSPDLLLGAAERLGKLPGLARAIRWRASRVEPPDGAKLFVNLHPEDLKDEDLYSPSSPLSRLADRIVLEITERASLDKMEDLGSRIERLRQLGFRIALDDLGAGYAGLSALTQLGPDIAKIDMSLIRNIDSEPRKRTVVARVQEMCSDLGVLVVAEGIETAAERDTVVRLGCDKMQGFLFAKPAAGFPAVTW